MVVLSRGVAVAAMVAVCGMAVAAQPATAPPTPSPAKPEAAAKPAAEVKALVERARKRIADAKTVRATTDAAWDMVMKDEEGEEQPTKTSMGWTLVRRGADTYSAECKMMRVHLTSDGKVVRMANKQLKQYTETPKADAPAQAEALRAYMSTPVLQMLLGEKAETATGVSCLESVEAIKEEPRNGRPGKLVTGTGVMPAMPFGDGKNKVSLWFADDTGLLEEARIDLTESMRAMNKDAEDAGGHGQNVVRAEMIERLKEVKLDGEVADSELTFDTKGLRKVDEFEYVGVEGNPQIELVGLAAPAIKGKDLAGAEFDLAALKGKVVVLDFWATWCGPCVQALPSMQKLKDRFADKNVLFVGINRDQPGSDEKVRKFLEKKSVTIRQFMDEEGTVAEGYNVNGIPCVVMIGTDGVINALHVGFSPGHEEQLAKEIETLLEGKRLFTPEELEKKKAAAREGAADDLEPMDVGEDAAVPAAKQTDVNPERLTIESGPRVMLWGHMVQDFDVDGDGKPEVVAPDPAGGGLVVLSKGGTEVMRVKPKGMGRQSQVMGFTMARANGEVRWVMATGVFTVSGAGKTSVGMYKPDGEALWTYALETEKGWSASALVAAGDLRGDGSVQTAVVMNSVKYQREGSRMSAAGMKSELIVLDGAGQVVARRHIGQSSEFVRVVPSGVAGQPATLLVGTGGRVRRVTVK